MSSLTITSTAADTAAEADVPDTRDMLVVHSAFRREFRLLAGLVRGTAEGDVARAKVVDDHLGLMIEFLHHHHTGEDELLWPTLLGRVGEEGTPTVFLMEAQHEKVSEQLDLVQSLRPAFVATADPASKGALATACDRLYALLEEHLRAEETRLLPLAERHLTKAEYNRLGEAGMGGTPKKQLPLIFGMFMYDGDPDTIKYMLSEAPLPIRLLMPRLGRGAFRRYAFRIHGTETPGR